MNGHDHRETHDNCTFKKPSVVSSLSIQTTSSTIHDDESSCLTSSRQASLENGSLQKKSASPYGSNNNTTHLSLPKLLSTIVIQHKDKYDPQAIQW